MSWNELTTAALLGTERGASPDLPSALADVLSANRPGNREVCFLTEAGAFSLWRRAGWIPPQRQVSATFCEPDAVRLIGQASIGHLLSMLQNRFAGVLPEWLSEAARLGLRLPPELLPPLLDRARSDRTLRPIVAEAGGQRANWLASLNPAWTFAADDSPEHWETGTPDQRIAVYRRMRMADPADALEKLKSVWDSEPAATRSGFLSELVQGLSAADEAFLETALDDRSKEVRRSATDLLARLPQSRFAARMQERVAPLLVFKPAKLLGRPSLTVQLGPPPDPAAIRDGIDAKMFGNQKTLGERATELLILIGSIAPGHWTETFQATPEVLLKAIEKDEFARAVITGWAWAAIRHGDAAWAEVLLDAAVEPLREFLPPTPLLAILSEAKRASRLLAHIKAGAMDKLGSAEALQCAAELTVLSSWPEDLSEAVLAALRRSTSKGVPWHLRSPIETLLLRLPRQSLANADKGWTEDAEGVAAFLELLTFRKDALSSLTPSL